MFSKRSTLYNWYMILKFKLTYHQHIIFWFQLCSNEMNSREWVDIVSNVFFNWSINLYLSYSFLFQIGIFEFILHLYYIIQFSLYCFSLLFNHPNLQTWANFYFLLNYLNDISLTKINYKKEFINILHIAKYNKFPISKIHKLYNKIKTKINQKKHTTLNNKKNKGIPWASIEYCKGVSEKIEENMSRT